MSYSFSVTGQTLLALGKLQQMTSKTGEVLPVLVNPQTKRIFEIAKASRGIVGGGSAMSQPVFAAFRLVGTAAEMYQTHRGFQKTYRMIGTLQQSLGVLQTTTSILGAGTVVSGVLGAMNLHQMLKLREDVRQSRKELTNGFLDIKQALIEQNQEFTNNFSEIKQALTEQNRELTDGFLNIKQAFTEQNQELANSFSEIKQGLTEHGQEILHCIDEKAFEERCRELHRAYARFTEAIKLVGFAQEFQNSTARDNYLANAVQTMNESLATYSDPHLLSKMNAAEKLRRFECAWTIEQAIALVFQLQNEPIAASKCVLDLQQKIRQDTLSVATACESQAELDFIFPEITRIHNQDLMVLEAWQTQIDVLRSLSPSELQQLSNLGSEESEVIDAEPIQIPEEETAYNTLKAKSDFYALRDQLKFMIDPKLRQKCESQIEELVARSKYPALIPSNWHDVSDLTVTNLYWYLNNSKDIQEQEVPA